MRLADIAARRGDVAAAREFYQLALTAAEADVSGMDAAVALAGYAMFETTMGDIEVARPLSATAEQAVAQLTSAHPARHHLTAVVAVSALMLALADGDLSVARERAAAAYQAAIESEDMPLAATVGGAVAYLAHALGHAERAAAMLGACVAVRGGEDLTDLMVTLLGSRLREALGRDAYDRAYAAGKALGRAEAISRLDPATL